MDELLAFIQSIRKDGGLPVKPDTLLFKERVLDSLNVLSLIGYVEQRLGRSLEDREVNMRNFESASKIVAAFFEGVD